jgi:hypothetical protein
VKAPSSAERIFRSSPTKKSFPETAATTSPSPPAAIISGVGNSSFPRLFADSRSLLDVGPILCGPPTSITSMLDVDACWRPCGSSDRSVAARRMRSP